MRLADDTLIVTHANRAARSLFHLRDDDLGHVSLPHVVPEQLADLLTSSCAAVGAAGKPANIDQVEWLIPGGKHPHWMNVHIRRIYGRVSLMCLDVTATHRATDELRLSQAHYRMLAEYSSDLVFTSEQGVLSWVSPSVKSVLGWKPADMVGKHARFCAPR